MPSYNEKGNMNGENIEEIDYSTETASFEMRARELVAAKRSFSVVNAKGDLERVAELIHKIMGEQKGASQTAPVPLGPAMLPVMALAGFSEWWKFGDGVYVIKAPLALKQSSGDIPIQVTWNPLPFTP